MPAKLPQNIEAEEVVLGLMLISKSCLVAGIRELNPNAFHKRTHTMIFTGIQALFEKGKEVSLISLTEQLKSTNSLEAVGGPVALSELAASSISDAEFNTYMEILIDKATKRSVIAAADKVMQAGFEDKLDTAGFLKLTMEEISQATRGVSREVIIISSGDIYEERRKILLDRLKHNVVGFGYPELDEKVISGMAPGDISVIAARPGMGKSAFKSNIKLNQLEAGFGVVGFELEQGFASEQDRMESLMTDIPLGEIIRSREWAESDYRIDLVKEANRKMDEKFNYHIIPSRGITLSDARTALYQITQSFPIHVVFFDLFDKLVDVNVAANKAQTVGVKINEIAQMAEEFNVHMCCLVQINRRVEHRGGDHRPRLSDLKDSGNYEEAARLVLLLYRENYYFEDSMNEDMEIIIAKQSNGPPGVIAMKFDTDTLRMTPPEKYLGI